jgi:hypothetical protein
MDARGHSQEINLTQNYNGKVFLQLKPRKRLLEYEYVRKKRIPAANQGRSRQGWDACVG